MSALDEGLQQARYTQLMQHFDEACDLEGAARVDYLARLGADDSAMAEELAALLVHDQPAALAVTREGAVGALALGVALLGERDTLPEMIGSYRILRVLGEGGMGTVLEAEQLAPRRRVALKVLRSELASSRVRRRFRAEAEILARLSHPGIARVFEAVTDTPEPYLVMELVDGLSLGAWAELQRPTLRRRVELLAAVCDAVDHAHRNGVVHRDLKPANIMVDGAGAPKVLDFGIARVMDRAGDSKDGATPSPDAAAVHGRGSGTASGTGHGTAMTRAGEVIGTPAYMSPEQTRLDPTAVDHRTDVYALGVVGYELMTGQMPYAIDRGDIIVSFTRIRDDVPTLAGRLVRELRGDLEVILGKALEKAPERRYTSAQALADDLRRWLRAEPVLARAPSTLYQIARFARRNRALVVSFVALFVALVAGVISATLLYLAGRDTQAELSRRVDELTLLQARATLANDPTQAVRWLGGMSAGAAWDRAWALAWEAGERGVSEWTLGGHAGDVEWVEAAPGSGARGGHLASASFDGTVRIYDLARGTSVALSGHDGGVNRAAWSPDGSRVASAGRDGQVLVWSVEGARLATLRAHRGESEDVAWSPDGQRIASVGGDGVLWLGDVARGEGQALVTAASGFKDVDWRGDTLVAVGGDRALHVWNVRAGEDEVLTGHRALINHVALSPFTDARERPRIATGASDGELRVWDGDGTVRAFDNPDGSGLKGVVFVSSDVVATVDRAGGLRLWDVASGSVRVLAEGGNVYRDLQVSPDGRWIATASDDRTVGLWDLQTFEAMTLRGHREAVQHVAFLGDGSRVVSCANDGDVRVWRVPRARTQWGLDAWPRALAVSGRQLAVVTADGALERIDLSTGAVDRVADGEDALLVAWSAGGDRIISASRSGTVSAWTPGGQLTRRVEIGLRPIRLEVAPSADVWAAATSEGALAIVDGTGRRDIAFAPGARAEDLAFASDARLVSGHRDGVVRASDVASDGFEQLARLDASVHWVRARPGWVAVASQDGNVRRWSVADDVFTASGGAERGGPITALAIGDDGRVAFGERDGTVNVLGGEGEQRMRGHVRAVAALAWVGATLVSGGEDRTVRVWDERGDASVIDLFEGPIVALGSVALPAHDESGLAEVGAGHERGVLVLADEPTLYLWPVPVPRDEASARALIARLVRSTPLHPTEVGP